MFVRIAKDARHFELKIIALSSTINPVPVLDARTGANLIW
jgi:hypothetical protein